MRGLRSFIRPLRLFEKMAVKFEKQLDKTITRNFGPKNSLLDWYVLQGSFYWFSRDCCLLFLSILSMVELHWSCLCCRRNSRCKHSTSQCFAFAQIRSVIHLTQSLDLVYKHSYYNLLDSRGIRERRSVLRKELLESHSFSLRFQHATKKYRKLL